MFFLFFWALLRKALIGTSIFASFSSSSSTYNVKLWWLLLFGGAGGCCTKGGSIARTSECDKLEYSFSFSNRYKFVIKYENNIKCIFITWKFHIMYINILICQHINMLNTWNMVHSFSMMFNMLWNIQKNDTYQIAIEDVKLYS